MDSSMTSNLLNANKFRPIIEVPTQPGPETPGPINYKTAQHNNHKDLATRFLFECGTKLKASAVVSASAAQIYHRFFEASSDSGYDPYLVAATSLYIASKQLDEPIKIRDLINVVHRTLNRDSEVLDLNDEYWTYRDTIVQAELLTMRMICFKSTSPDMHLYLLNYLKTLESWISPSVWEKVPLVKFCWTVLNDFHHCKAIINYEPQLVALAVIFFGLQVYGITVPCTTEHDQTTWHETFHASAKKDDIWAVLEKIMDFYEQDKGMK